MSANYTGAPAATQAPAVAPSLTAYPIGSVPSDGDAISAASVNQDFKVALDYIAYLQDRFRDLLFGDGSDGALAYNGAGNVQLTGNKFYTTCDISIGTLRPNGWPIFCRTSFTLSTSSGALNGSGGNAATSTRGLYNATVGGPHGSVSPTDGSAASAYGYTGMVHYGLGGNGAIGGGGSPTATTIISPGNAHKIYPYRMCAGAQTVGTLNFPPSTTAQYGGVQYDSIRGGGAGMPGGVAASSTGGGGGAGGALVVVIAPTITLALNSFVGSNGGLGGAGAGTTGHGGGGGGGGAFLFVCKTFIDNGATYSATGGTGGLGVGAGGAGSTGAAGNTTPFVVLVP